MNMVTFQVVSISDFCGSAETHRVAFVMSSLYTKSMLYNLNVLFPWISSIVLCTGTIVSVLQCLGVANEILRALVAK